jgi:hypothetical protein
MLEIAKIIEELKGKSLGELLREYSQDSSKERDEETKPQSPEGDFRAKDEQAYREAVQKAVN